MKSKQTPYLKILLFITLVIASFALAQYILIYTNRMVVELSANKTSSTNTDAAINTTVTRSYSTKPLFHRVPPASEIFEKPFAKRKLSFQDHLAIQAELRLQSNVAYNGSYKKIAYPMGDVPDNIGVCTDVVIRSFRGLGIDLQQRVHEDMSSSFRSYPTKWKLRKPDTNIDHRRVPNLMTYFERSGASLKITDDPLDYFAGNVVAWELDKDKGLVHIGIVSNYVSEVTSNPLIVHNIGAGPQMNDMLFDYKIIGHYKYGD